MTDLEARLRDHLCDPGDLDVAIIALGEPRGDTGYRGSATLSHRPSTGLLLGRASLMLGPRGGSRR